MTATVVADRPSTVNRTGPPGLAIPPRRGRVRVGDTDRLEVRIGHGDDTDDMGFNPFRAQRRSTADYVMVAVAVVVCVLLVAWAVFG